MSSEQADGYVAARDEQGRLTAVGGQEVGALGRETLRWQAAVRKASEVLRRDGALNRANLYPRALTRQLAEGTLNLMLAKILTGEVEPRTAKEAAEVAKIVDEIARRHSGEDAKPEVRSVERDQQVVNIKQLHVHLMQRAQQAEAALPAGETLDVEEAEPDVWDHDEPEVSDGN